VCQGSGLRGGKQEEKRREGKRQKYFVASFAVSFVDKDRDKDRDEDYRLPLNPGGARVVGPDGGGIQGAPVDGWSVYSRGSGVKTREKCGKRGATLNAVMGQWRRGVMPGAWGSGAGVEVIRGNPGLKALASFRLKPVLWREVLPRHLSARVPPSGGSNQGASAPYNPFRRKRSCFAHKPCTSPSRHYATDPLLNAS